MAKRGRDGDDERRKDAGRTEGASTATPSKPGRETEKDAGSTPEDIEEVGGPKGPEPTRYGDWQKGGRCSDF